MIYFSCIQLILHIRIAYIRIAYILNFVKQIMNPIIIDFEFHTGLGPTYAARFLGVAYSTYAEYRRGTRSLPKYIHRHIQTVYLLSNDVLNEQLNKYAYKEVR